jgi:heterodisulfide reductase subunit A-like polyferredoxin
MLEEAAQLIDQSLPYPAITGRLCTHPCEKACARKKVDEPINIRGLERYVGDYLIEQKLERFPVRHASKIAVIGSGPVGMAVANDLCRMGYVVTVFEKEDHLGGSFLKTIRKGELKGEIFESEIERLIKLGVVFSVNTCLSKNVGIDELKDMRYDAIFLASGITPDLASMKQYQNIQGFFFEQDLLTKEIPLIAAIATAKDAAIRIDQYLKVKDGISTSKVKPEKALNIPRNGIKPRPRLEKENGFDEKTAEQETYRCMSCGSMATIAYPEDCMTCYDCEVQCPVGAIKVHPFKEVLPLSLALNNQ